MHPVDRGHTGLLIITHDLLEWKFNSNFAIKLIKYLTSSKYYRKSKFSIQYYAVISYIFSQFKPSLPACRQLFITHKGWEQRKSIINSSRKEHIFIHIVSIPVRV